MRTTYPFSALVGSDQMALALTLTTVAPAIGGVLIRGEKGTAKSTAVRALGALHPPLVELPIGATEDRVVGSIQLEQALTEGRVEVEKGLLARADGGLLYVDEVNLLHDHLVDLLLDAAATGRVSVERDGISVTHDARFVLVGTMNPEEGELRPQLLDRFGLTVEVAAPREPALRAEVVRRRIAFDADPETFVELFAAEEKAFAVRIAAARALLDGVDLDEQALLTIAEICAAFEVDGLRADIVTARTAVAHAAWEGRTVVTRADIRAAALLALPHRRRRNPFDAPGMDEDLLDRILDGFDEPEPEPDPEPPATPPGAPEGSDTSAMDDAAPGEPAPDEPAPHDPAPHDPAPHDSVPHEPAEQAQAPGDAGAQQTVVGASAPYRPQLLAVAGLGAGSSGKRSRSRSTTGRRVGARAGSDGGLHLVETIKTAAAAGRRRLRAEDLRVAVREGREANLILFCVDASGSMAARRRMTQVKTTVLSLLLDAYRRRDKVAMITFRGQGAELLLPPTGSTDVAAARLETLPAGGRTPLAAGLQEAARVIVRERRRDPALRPLLIVVTDGRATAGGDPLLAADGIARLGITSVVLDSETGPMRLGLAERLAERMGATHLPAEALGDLLDARGSAGTGAA